MYRRFLFALVFLPELPLAAQSANPTNLWSVSLRWKGDSLITGKPVKLTHDEVSNSQPSFSPDGKFLVFSRVSDTIADARSDIYRIELSSGREIRVTSTAENENSPTMNAHGEYAAVRWVPATLFKEFGVWIYDRNGVPKRGVLPGADTTGYYTPLGHGKYSLTRPRARTFTIAIFDSVSGKIVDVDSGVPALPAQRIPGQNALSYVHIDTANAHHELRRVDLATNSVTSLGAALPGRTAHAWVAGHNVLLMAKGHSLYERRNASSGQWKKVADFTDGGLQAATAYVVSPAGDRLILLSPLRPTLAAALRDSLESGIPAAKLADAVIAWKEEGELAGVDYTEGSIRGLSNERIQKKFAADGVAIAKLATKLWPASYRAQTQLGAAELASNNKSAALAAYQRALELNPRESDADKKAVEAIEKSIRDLGTEP